MLWCETCNLAVRNGGSRGTATGARPLVRGTLSAGKRGHVSIRGQYDVHSQVTVLACKIFRLFVGNKDVDRLVSTLPNAQVSIKGRQASL